jgi:ribonuclease VapC
MIVVDTSAIVAIVFCESDAEAVAARLLKDVSKAISAASVVEAGAVLAGRHKQGIAAGLQELHEFLLRGSIKIHPVDEAQSWLALDARIRFGKSFGTRKGLNFGDSFSYALAKSLNAPLLYKGGDFKVTDIEPALS